MSTHYKGLAMATVTELTRSEGDDNRASLRDWVETGKVAPKNWMCMECGKRLTFKQAEKASYGVQGCPKCGGVDISLRESDG